MNYVNLLKPKWLITMFTITSLGLFSVGCGGDGGSHRNFTIPGVNGPTIHLQQDKILISMVMEKIQVDGGLRYSIPKYPNSSIELGPDFQSDGTLLSFSIDLDDVFSGNANQLDPQALPGGRAIPGVASGQLPAVAFTIEKFENVSIYLGPKVFAIFIPIKGMNMDNTILTFRHYVNNTRVGNLSLVGEDINGENSGIFLALDLGKYKNQLQKIASTR
ncbi:MAG: hypothetical protein H6622_07435 [Halobacteriovoraceae bacterium]|nr:hypothetical protein [Halobacteriovoraceae bacterium]